MTSPTCSSQKSNTKPKPKSLADLPTEVIEEIVLDVCPIYRPDALEMPGVRPEGRDRQEKRSSDDFWLKERVNDLKRLLRTCKALYEAANPLLYRCPFILSGPMLKSYVAPPEKTVIRKLTQLLRTLEEAPMLADLAVAFFCEDPAWVALDNHLRQSAVRVGLPVPDEDADVEDIPVVSLARLVLAGLPRARSLTMISGFYPMINPGGKIRLESLKSLVVSSTSPAGARPVRIGVGMPNLRTLCLRGARERDDPDIGGLMGGRPLRHLTRLVVDVDWTTPSALPFMSSHVARLERFAYKTDELGPACPLIPVASDTALVEALAQRCAGSLRTLCLDVGERQRAGSAAPSFTLFCKLEDVWIKSDVVVDSGRGTAEGPQLGIWSLPPSLRRLHVKVNSSRRGVERQGDTVNGGSIEGKYSAILNEWLTTKVAEGAYPALEELAISDYTCPQEIADEVSELGIKLLEDVDLFPLLW
ncbi:hypothetical protein CPLU01_09521 [Colletotrichum plurivorum]|uniref:Uncharacterized protein n=1 Tax=Colletotrichum plurivorum TaxID=2175906 RepID=A0A8H6NBP3_9PEZI|nr:hypothetical protein CPLU01_09521 [Colletotrichum plurivorum]